MQIEDEKCTEYSELFELAQRKFLRQVANFSDTATTKPFPRLFCLDINESRESLESDKSSPSNSKRLTSTRQISGKSSSKSLFANISSYSSSNNFSPSIHENQFNSSPSSVSDSRKGKMCLRALCEHEQGWHPVGGTLEYESLSNMPNNHFAYMIRILSLIKQSNFDLKIVNNIEKLVDIINYIDDNLGPSIDEVTVYNEMSSALSTANSAYTSNNFKDSYEMLKYYIIEKLEKLEQYQTFLKTNSKFSKSSQEISNTKKSQNANRIDFFNLNRCALPNGKILW